MNTTKLNEMLDAYLEDFDKNWAEEEYKWIEIKRFQDNFDLRCRPEEFTDMLKSAIDVVSNLFASSHYYPINEILLICASKAEIVQEAMNILLDEKHELANRIDTYVSIIKAVKKELGSNSVSDGHDLRFISTLLCFAYPWKYTIYKYTENKKFAEDFEFGLTIKKGSLSALENSVTIVELIISHLTEKRRDIISKYKEKLQNPLYYNDESLHLLAQNIIWYAANYEVQDRVSSVEVSFEHGALERSYYSAAISKTGSKKDYIKQAKENERVGNSGESFVIEYENIRLKPLNKSASWVSKEKGDGLGYDILSYNDDGSKRYIEVKTTTGAENNIFFITATELAACKLYGENYYLYRVYKKNGNWEISWYRGKEVESLCNCPCQYAVAVEQ